MPLQDEKAMDKVSGLSKQEILFPPQIQTEPYQIIIRVLKGDHIYRFSRTFNRGGCDPFVQVEYGELTYLKTKFIENNPNPQWNEEILVFY